MPEGFPSSVRPARSQLELCYTFAMETKTVTSYTEPDLDGYSCAIAYAEFLNKTDTPAMVRLFGKPHIEATHLVEKFGFKIEQDDQATLEKVVLVDASEIKNFNTLIDFKNVVEVIDHRKMNDAPMFINANVQIEFVGAAATLIAEKFQQNNIKISKASATLLYGAIVSNTLNFRAKVTTDRDRAMAKWLNGQLGFTKEFIDDMFRAKSDVTGQKLMERIDADFAIFPFGKKKLGFGQLEITDVKSLISTRKDELLSILETLKTNDGLDAVFSSFIDLGEGFNAFVTEDIELQSILSEILDIKFEDGVAFRDGYIMRKELAPLLKEKFS